MLADHYNQYADGALWSMVRRTGSGRFYDTGRIDIRLPPFISRSIHCRPGQLYRLVLENGTERIVGLDVEVTDIENPGTRKARQLHRHEDVILSLSLIHI